MSMRRSLLIAQRNATDLERHLLYTFRGIEMRPICPYKCMKGLPRTGDR